MRLAGLVAAVHGAFDVPAAIADVAALCEHDRYQAGAGIDAAAAHVAERAADAGLIDVEVLRFPADGARRWWTFAAPPSWTPQRAWVHVDGTPVLCYPEQPYALAANSAATPAGGLRLPLVHWSAGVGHPDPVGALVVLHDTPLPTALGELVAHGAAGVLADPLAGCAGRWPGQVGRIELPVGCGLFAFSATEQQLVALRRATVADVLVEVEAGAGTLPVVTGRLPDADSSDPRGELLLSAHLCHPRPSANDNASGVAALLGIARAHAALGAGRTVRFVWGPEFVGMAAYLHDVVHARHASKPVAAVNVDMAGEDQHRCGGPLVIERAPDELPSPLSAIAERCVALIPPAARSYSGAVPCDTWAWRATPYVGASDHAMLAGPPTGCPAISLGHWPDAANHTSADTLDLVDPDELRRTATIAGATVAAMRALRGDPELAADVADSTVAWAAAHVLSALPGQRSPAPPPADGPVLDPWAQEQTARRLNHRGAVALDVVRSLRGTAVPTYAIDRAAEWIAGLAGPASALSGPRSHQAGPSEPARAPDDADVLSVRWDGPLNLRHLAECAEPDDRRWLAEISAHDRGGNYARLLAMARGLDGRRDRRAVAWWAALTSELAVPVPMAQRFLGLLCRAGWARPTQPPTGEAAC
jgi:peptidase M28-like protein